MKCEEADEQIGRIVEAIELGPKRKVHMMAIGWEKNVTEILDAAGL